MMWDYHMQAAEKLEGHYILDSSMKISRRANSPPQPRRGGCAIKESREATIARADGVVLVSGQT